MAKHIVKCSICGETFDANSVPFEKTSERRYAHKVCCENKPQELKDLEDLEEYIKKLLNVEYVNPRIKKQIENFKNEYNYSYTGMKKALVYFYEIRKNDISKANGGVGIIPYIYQEAYLYYYNLWLINQQNKDKNISDYVPEVIEVRIPAPQRKIRKSKAFSFLDEEGFE